MHPPTLEELLHDNLIDVDQFKANPSSVKTLECFHYDLPVHPDFSPFTGLIELRVIEQDVVDLEWLKDCKNLQTLIVYHTTLKDISGIQYSVYIKQLILEGNKITDFPDISKLTDIVELSVAENPIKEIKEFPKNDSLQILNLSSTGISYLSDSIANLPNIRKLQLANNNLHDYSLFKTLSQLPKLQELYLYDPIYDENPICSFPNYDVLPVALLPNLTILDTYKINDKMREKSQSRRKNAELYYLFEASSNMSLVYDELEEFHSKANEYLSSITYENPIDRELFSEIYNIIKHFDEIGISLQEFYRQASTTTFLSGGCTTIEQIDTEDEKSRDLEDTILSKCTTKDNFTLYGVWKVTHTASLSEIEKDELVEPSKFEIVTPESLNESIKWLSDWNHIQNSLEVTSNLTINKQSTVIFCHPRQKSQTLVPQYIAFFCESFEYAAREIERICSQIKENHIPMEPIINDESLMLVSKPFELKETLTSVTLTNCGIESLSVFSGLQNLKYLSIPFNKITTVRDLPEIPQLEVLDVSFNRISTIPDLFPDSDAASDVVKLFIFFGNPICTPRTISLSMQFFRNSSPVISEPKIPLYVPIEAPSDVFLTSVFPSGIQLEQISSLDFRNQCLVTLAPLSELPALKILYASDNMLTNIDFSSKTLTFGDFSLNSIKNFPTEENFPALETLLLNGNSITKLSRIENLLALFISDNNVEELISDELFPNLVSLCCNGNPLLKNYNENRIIFSLPKLKMLNGTRITPALATKAKNMYTGVLFAESNTSLFKTGSTTIILSEKGLKDVNSLKSDTLIDLDLSKNNISTITWESTSLPRLQKLNLSNNAMLLFDFVQFLPRLRYIDLSFNKITDDIFSCLQNTPFQSLQTLIVANNSIKSVDSFSQKHFPNLETLSLSHNYINKIGAGAFAHPKLTTIDLSYNSLKKLDNIASPQILALDVSHNRIPTVEEVEKLRICSQLVQFAFNDNNLTQRISPRIRILSILRSVKELDGKQVTESDLNQVRIIIEQMTGGPIISARSPKAAAAPVQTQALPPLQGGMKKKTLRYPRQ
ncbi:Leucine Rich Repeat family protein [Trichomonas vaginalis G3]|uniref:Leucine Rich Repeat family protein n=1 Tax=Trichomonas vaginalis (strain ATCC PRA-98 / G3) TaxID=412133 RepID=A2DJY4_TRIV3|nr:uncharacterized protein TVAGG3_0290800 [Trichomonas vaginalis G3]EAY19348.1 Leucine Rich Repeat family protein [Trichomonas vaginalis G3]KAI5527255.1 regulation of response to stimulus [Trichomonas vaginalis G3]|eukprot:XP_001580334.1 hypothetical protein [Trichomonas vaginalis G3]